MRKELRSVRHQERFVVVACLFALCFFFQTLSFPAYGKTKDGPDILQFTSKGHVLGFSHSSMYLASADHMLKVDFMGGKPVAPVADKAGRSDGRAQPLSKVTYAGVWEGIDVVYEKSSGSVVKSTYTVSGGREPDSIRLRYNRPLTVDDKGNLVIRYDTGRMTESQPVAWQVIEGRRKPVMVAYALISEREAGFTVGDYDKSLPLVIDPELTWNTFLGGYGADLGYGIAVDSSGNVYVTGWSNGEWYVKPDWPVRDWTWDYDAFAVKMTGEGVVEWYTYLGGSGADCGYAIAVDSSGNVYVTGWSAAAWTVTGITAVRAYSGSNDAFAVKLTSAGAVEWYTFLGGSGNDYGYGIAVDSSKNVYLSGVSAAAWTVTGITAVRDYTASNDAFAVKLTSAGGRGVVHLSRGKR